MTVFFLNVKIFCFVGLVSCLLSCSQTTPFREKAYVDDSNKERIKKVKEVLKQTPSDAASRIELGRIYLREEMVLESIGEFQKALEIDPQNIDACLFLISVLQKTPKPDWMKIRILLENASQIAPANPSVHLHLGKVYSRLNEDEKAKSEFNKCLSLSVDPFTRLSAHLGLMSIYEKQGDRSKSESEYNAAAKIYPNIGKLLEQSYINRKTPYADITHLLLLEDADMDKRSHPSFEKRINKLMETINTTQKDAR